MLADKVIQSLSRRLQTPFSLQKIELQFFNRALLEGLYIEGLNGDTLLYAGKLEARLSLLAPFRQELEVKSIHLGQTVANLSRSPDGVYNFQFIIDAFSSPEPDSSQAPSPWKFGLQKVTITDTRFTLADSVSQSSLFVKVGDFSGLLQNLSIPEQRIDIGRMHLKNSVCNYATRPEPGTAIPSQSDTAATLEFPFSGWALTAERLHVENAGFGLDDFSQPPGPAGQFDPSHLHMEDIHADIRAFSWSDTLLTTRVHRLAFREMNGFNLGKLTAKVDVSPVAITLSDVELETPGSSMEAPLARLRFPAFASLSNFIEDVDMEVELSPSYFAMEDLRYWGGPLPYIRAGYTGKARLSGNLLGKVNRLSTSRLYAALDDALYVQLSGNIRGLPEVEAMSFGVQVVEFQASYRGLSRITEGLGLPAGLGSMGAFRLNGYVGGRIDSLFTRRLTIRTDGYTYFSGRATVTGLPDINKAYFQLDMDKLQSQPSELAGFVEGELPQPLAALGKMQYQGRFEGTLYDFRLAGRLQSEQGQLQEDASLQFNNDFSNASYTGTATLAGLQLGTILGDTAMLGAATMSLEANGRGLSLDSLSANIVATVQSITLRGYEYRDIQADGLFQQRRFEGRMNVDDPHLCFQLEGLADLSDSIPGIDFILQLDTADLAYLNFYPGALRLSTRAEAHLKGNNLDNLSGTAALRELAVSDEKNSFFADSITLDAYQLSTEHRVAHLRSDIAEARLEGNYRAGELSGLLQEFVDGFFPVKRLLEPDGSPDSLLVPPSYASQDFRFSASLSHPVRLFRIFLPDLQVLDTASFQGQFNSLEKRLQLLGQIPRLEYNGLQLDTLQLSMQGSPEELGHKLSFQALKQDGEPLLGYSEASARMFRDSLLFRLNMWDDTTGHKLGLQGLVVAPDERYHLQLSGPMVLNTYNWAIPENNDITFAPGYLNVENLKFTRNQQEFRIQSRDKTKGESLAPIDISFRQFRLVELSRLAGLDEHFISGAINGQVTISRPDTVLHYEANLDVRQLMIDSQALGELALYAAPTANQESLGINAQLSGGENAFSLAGSYGLANGELAFNLKVSRLQMALADFFAGGTISQSRGTLRGELEVGGTVEKPVILGSIGLDSVSAFVNYLQSRYLVPSHTLYLRETTVDLGQMELLDPDNRKAILEGQVSHKFLNDIQLNLHFSAPAFQVLHTGPEDNDLFYGKILVAMDARVNGPLGSPTINIFTQTLPGTHLTALPLTEEEAIAQQEGFILYGKPSEHQSDTSRASFYQASVSGYALNLQLELTPDAELTAIIDPATGDKLTARGRANLLVEMDRSGRLSTTGDISITEGAYFFNYEGLVKRTFQIREGSHMFLPGDPLEARFDITAQYAARTPIYELISQQAGLSPEEARAAKRRTDVQVIMNLKGTLSKPEITFDIQLPEAQASAVANTAESKLAQLRENGNELNKQVFGLLLFNSFIAEQSGTTSLAMAGENIALTSVSNLVTNQLNRLASQYIKGVALEVRLDSYRTAGQEGAASTVTDLGLDLSKQLFNDRLSVKVGGTVGLGETTGAEEFTALASEFLLEYLLTEDGRYRVRVFRRPDYDIIKTSNTVRTGVSILYKKSFGGAHDQQDTTKTDKR